MLRDVSGESYWNVVYSKIVPYLWCTSIYASTSPLSLEMMPKMLHTVIAANSYRVRIPHTAISLLRMLRMIECSFSLQKLFEKNLIRECWPVITVFKSLVTIKSLMKSIEKWKTHECSECCRHRRRSKKEKHERESSADWICFRRHVVHAS
jgi:hypothetical protein